MTGEDRAFRDSVFEILLSSHDMVENARVAGPEGRLLRRGRQQLRRLGLCRRGALPAGAVPFPARGPSPAVPDLRRRSDGHDGPHPGRGRPQPAVRSGLRAGTGQASRRTADRAERRNRRNRRKYPVRRSHCRSHHGGAGPASGTTPKVARRTSMPAPCSRPWETRSSPDRRGIICATCGC